MILHHEDYREQKKVTAKYANHAKEKRFVGSSFSRIWRISRLKLLDAGRKPGDDTKQTQFHGVGRPVEYPAFHCSIIPPFQTGSYRAKQTQFFDRGFGIADSQRLAARCPDLRGLVVQTKPIRGRGLSCKQTQFRLAWAGCLRAEDVKQTQSGDCQYRIAD
jgi:hypothetical protein